MRPIFSNISYFLRTVFTFFTYHTNFLGGFETPKKIENFSRNISLLLLEILSMMPGKNSFQTELMVKVLVSW